MDVFQRHQLEVQYRILDRLDPDNGWSRAVRILQEGIETEYAGLMVRFHEPVTTDDAALAERILHMFESLTDSLGALPDDTADWRRWGRFMGFDFNDTYEAKLAGYCAFLFDDGRWSSLRPQRGLNAHGPMLDRYRDMLDRFLPFDERGRDYRTQPLTRKELELIIGAAAAS